MEKLIVGEVRKLGRSGGVQRDTTQGRNLEKPWKGRSFTNFDRGVFYTQQYRLQLALVVFLFSHFNKEPASKLEEDIFIDLINGYTIY